MIDHNMFQSTSARPEHRFRYQKQGPPTHTFSAALPCRALLYSFGEPRIRSSLAAGRGITTTGVPNLGNRQSSQLGDDSLDILARDRQPGALVELVGPA